VDYSIGAKRVEKWLRSPDFSGYRCKSIKDLKPEPLLGAPWKEITPSGPIDESQQKKPFIKLAKFQKLGSDSSNPAAEEMTILYICGEAARICYKLYRRPFVPPACLVYLNPGPYEGENYLDFPALLAYTFVEEKGCLPEFLFHDYSGMDEKSDDFFSLSEIYLPMEEKDLDHPLPPNIALHKLKDPLGPMDFLIVQAGAKSPLMMRRFFERRRQEAQAKSRS
jgi:hypothetical protein